MRASGCPSLPKAETNAPHLPLHPSAWPVSRMFALAMITALVAASSQAQKSVPAVVNASTSIGAAATPGAAVATPEAMRQIASDPVMKAMQAELDRSKNELQLQSMQKPFFIEYRLDDVRSYDAEAAFGALTAENNSHQRAVRVTVRIGDYKTDSSGERGDGTLMLAADDNDPVALRYALWSATDSAYKAALRSYTQKQAALKTFQTPPNADDFSQQKPVVKIEPLVALDLDTAAWKKIVADASGLFLSAPEVRSLAPFVEYSSANIHGIALNRYLVNSEGTAVRHGYSGYEARVEAETQAPDGMRLARSSTATGVGQAQNNSQTKDAESFRSKTLAMLQALGELRDAPVVAEVYHGPVLFSGAATADIFADLFTGDIEAQKPAIGTTARTRGTFASSYKARVLPDFINVTDDPSMKTLDGTGLFGAYDIDDEGVQAQAVPVVQKGILKNYLIGRYPVKDFPESNGHGRAAIAQPSGPRAGVLVVAATDPMPVKALEDKLLGMAKDQGIDYVYQVELMGGRLDPRMIYRVRAADGKRELVRGAALEELDQRSLRSDIVAAGDDQHIMNSLAPVPMTTITPSLLFGDVGVKRATEEQEKLPYYPPPAAAR